MDIGLRKEAECLVPGEFSRAEPLPCPVSSVFHVEFRYKRRNNPSTYLRKQMIEMQAFLTGSRVYGTPREDSDLDMFVYCPDQATLDLLTESADDETIGCADDDYDGESANRVILRFGKLNLLCTTKKADYAAWKDGTALLTSRKPVTRDEAKRVLRGLREDKELYGGDLLRQPIGDR